MQHCDPTLSLKLHSAEASDSCDRDTIHPVTRHCTINMILKLLFKVKKRKKRVT